MSAQMRDQNWIVDLRMAFAAAALLAASTAGAVDIERPPVQFVDKFGVNMANGQVTHSLNTVSIGGAMGLSHSVSVYANEFNYPGMRGFGDKFYARAQNVQLCGLPTACNPFNVMRVEDGGGSHSFSYGGATGYVSIGDERHTLEVSGSEFLWTKPDGTVVHFNRGGTELDSKVGGTMSQIDYPNGFRIWVSQGSVNTNTGFQLKYDFNWTNLPLDKSVPAGLVAPIESPNWPLHNPRYIRGINASIEHCPWTTASCPNAGDEWPTAQFDWPAGMPRTMYIGDSIVKVTDSAKRVTTYKFHAYDLAYDRLNNPVSPYVPGTEFSPRLKEIIPPGASATKFTYDYENLFAANMWRMDYRLQSAGIVKSATRAGGGPNSAIGYTINHQFQGETQNLGAANGGITLVHQQNYEGNPSATYYIDTLDGRVWFEESGRNFPRRFDKVAAPAEEYFYETRSNLTKVNYNDPNGAGYQILAEYPAQCSNRKTCNQATRIRDANGNWTDYTYHAASGQVETITYPANKEGIRAQTRFTYAQKKAAYFNQSNVYETVSQDNAIWLKTAEEYCINSAASNGNCAAGDEVVTTYEYKHPNLLMTGMVVTTPDGVRRTCYTYDDFGNQIGVTTPKGTTALSVCPGPGVEP